MTLTSSSSLVLPFVQKFEAWREAWHRQVLADRQLGHRDKSVAGFLLWYLNRQERACFPSYATIAAGVGITRRDAMRCVARLVACGHLLRQPRERKTNYYSPRVVAPCHQGGGTVPPGGGGKLDTLTSKSRTSDLTLGRALKIQEEDRGSPRKQGSPNSPSGVPSSPGNSRPSAAPGGVPRGAADGPFITFDSPKWPLVEKYARDVLGFVPPGGRGWHFTTEQWAAINAAAVANGGGVP